MNYFRHWPIVIGLSISIFPSSIFSQHLGIDDLPDAESLACNGNLYLFQAVNNGVDTNFTQVNPDGTLTTWGNANSGIIDEITQINAIGFNVEDGLIYGYSTGQDYGDHVFAVDANGVTYDLGDPLGIGGSSISGDMDGMGNLVLIRGQNVYKIDVDVFPLAAVQVPIDDSGTGGSLPNNADFAIGPDNIMYGFDRNTNQIWTIDLNQNPAPTAYGATVTAPPVGSPGTGVLGAVGGLYFDSFGNLYGYHNNTTNGNPPGIYSFDTTTGVTRLVATGGRVRGNDGASCAYSVGFQKTVSPSIARPGETVTYTFGISNLDVNGAAFTGIEISDTLSTLHGGQFTGAVSIGGVALPPGDIVVSDANGGTDNAIEISDITVPPGGITYIDVEVTIPLDAELCSVLENSATVNDALGQIPVGSSWPPGAIGPGPTELTIVKPPTITKDVSVDEIDFENLPTTITYTFSIENTNPNILHGVDFSDSVPVGAIVNATLSDSLDGTVNAYGGTSSVSISDGFLPVGTTTITIDVLIGADAGNVGTHCNQANLDDAVADAFLVPSTDTADPAGSETETCIEIFGALPVELSSFEGFSQDGQHILKWTTLSESNVSRFEIEVQSQDNGEFENVGFVEAIGQSNTPRSYSWSQDADALVGTQSYRLKIIDLDGSFEYSSKVELATPLTALLRVGEVYPQPANNSVHFEIESKHESVVSMELFDLQGRLIRSMFTETVQAESRTRKTISVAGLGAGTYIYRLSGKSLGGQEVGSQVMGRIVVTH